MLFNSIQSAQNGDQNEMLYLISRFQSVICKYGRTLAYEDANDDLLVDFIDFVTKFDFKKLNNLTDGAIVNYIVRSIYRLYLHRLQRLINEGHSLSIEELTPTQRNQIEYRSATYNDEDLSFVIPEGLLTDKEYTVIRAIYEYGLTSSSISKILNVSRQNVNQIKKKAESKLRACFIK